VANYYKSTKILTSSTTKGISLRDELTTLFREEFEGTYYLYRRARLDANNYPIKHPETMTRRSGEPSRDIPVQGQSHSGYVYDDYLVFGYFNHSQAYSIYKRTRAAGDINIEYLTLYMEYDFLSKYTKNPLEVPNRFDNVFEIEKDLEGKIIYPIKAREQYGILSADAYRLDSNGRIEYYRIRLISLSQESFLV